MPPEENHRQDGEREEEEEAHEVTRFYTNPIAKPIPQSLEGSGHKPPSGVDDTIVALNMRAALRNGLEGSSEDASFQEDSLQEEWDKEIEPGLQQHPAGEAGGAVLRAGFAALWHPWLLLSSLLLLPEYKCCFSYLVQKFHLLSQRAFKLYLLSQRAFKFYLLSQ